MLLGLVRPTSGVIKFPLRASSWEYLRARSRVGAIIETPAFYENFSGRRNLQLLGFVVWRREKKRVEEVLEIVDLRDRAQDPVKVYSLRHAATSRNCAGAFTNTGADHSRRAYEWSRSARNTRDAKADSTSAR